MLDDVHAREVGGVVRVRGDLGESATERGGGHPALHHTGIVVAVGGGDGLERVQEGERLARLHQDAVDLGLAGPQVQGAGGIVRVGGLELGDHLDDPEGLGILRGEVRLHLGEAHGLGAGGGQCGVPHGLGDGLRLQPEPRLGGNHHGPALLEHEVRVGAGVAELRGLLHDPLADLGAIDLELQGSLLGRHQRGGHRHLLRGDLVGALLDGQADRAGQEGPNIGLHGVLDVLVRDERLERGGHELHRLVHLVGPGGGELVNGRLDVQGDAVDGVGDLGGAGGQVDHPVRGLHLHARGEVREGAGEGRPVHIQHRLHRAGAHNVRPDPGGIQRKSGEALDRGLVVHTKSGLGRLDLRGAVIGHDLHGLGHLRVKVLGKLGDGGACVQPTDVRAHHRGARGHLVLDVVGGTHVGGGEDAHHADDPHRRARESALLRRGLRLEASEGVERLLLVLPCHLSPTQTLSSPRVDPVRRIHPDPCQSASNVTVVTNGTRPALVAGGPACVGCVRRAESGRARTGRRRRRGG